MRGMSGIRVVRVMRVLEFRERVQGLGGIKIMKIWVSAHNQIRNYPMDRRGRMFSAAYTLKRNMEQPRNGAGTYED